MYDEAAGIYLLLRVLEHSEVRRVAAVVPLFKTVAVGGSYILWLLVGDASVRLALQAAWEQRMASMRREPIGRITAMVLRLPVGMCIKLVIPLCARKLRGVESAAIGAAKQTRK